ncbi:MAG: sulfite exporter TauE/SafE family protein [Parvularculaceae bacterium]
MDILAALTPDGLALSAALAVIAASFFTAALTAAFGLGGGLALIGLMSLLLPAPAVVPVHGLAQFGANASRFGLQRKSVVWPIVGWFGIGGVFGAALGGRIVVALPAWALQAGIAAFILYTLWGPKPKGFAPGKATFFLTGAAGAFLSMFFGATGPIAAAMLSATKLERLNFVATHAACMVAQHGVKIAAFGFLGFAYADWAVFIAAVVAAGFLGTATGTHILRHMPENVFRRGFRLILTLIAIYLLGAAAAFGLKTG